MKKRTKKLNLNRETLKVENFLDRAAGGLWTMQCHPTDVGQGNASDCENCTGGGIYTVWCQSGACTATC